MVTIKDLAKLCQDNAGLSFYLAEGEPIEYFGLSDGERQMYNTLIVDRITSPQDDEIIAYVSFETIYHRA